MLTFKELIDEIHHRSPEEQLALLEELAHSLRHKLTNSDQKETETAPTELNPEALGWPPGYFEQTYGSLRAEPLERGAQGEYEIREEIV
jgi:hypothetical protein